MPGKPSTLRKQTVPLVDDSKSILAALSRLLRREPYEVVTAIGGEEALQMMETKTFQLVVSDQCMPGMKGLELLREVRSRWPDTMRMILSGYTEVNTILAAINEGAIFRFITKPWNDDEIKLNITRALEQYELEAENRRMAREISEQNDRLRELNRRLEHRAADGRTGLARARELLEAVDVSVLTVDQGGVVVSANARAREILSSKNGELVGISAQLALPNELCEALRATATTTGEGVSGRLQLQGGSCQYRVTGLVAGGDCRGSVVTIWKEVP